MEINEEINSVVVNTKDTKLIDQLKGFAERSTWHAIPNIAASDRVFVKIIWLVGMIISFSLCLILLIKNLIDFLNFEVETVVEILRDSDALFPTVTICSSLQVCGLSNYSFDKYWSMYVRNELNSTGNLSTRDLNKILETYNTTFVSNKVKEYYFKNISVGDFTHAIKKNHESIRNMLISCKYGSEYCSEMDFEISRMSLFQRCYKFNSGRNMDSSSSKIKKARRYGKNYGLQLELYMGQQEKCKSPLSATYGAVAYVHNITENVTEDSNGVFLMPGSETNIAIDRIFVQSLSDPYNDCIENKNLNPPNSNKYIDQTFELLNGSYSRSTCIQLCEQKFNIETNNCYDESLPKIPRTTNNLQDCVDKSRSPFDLLKKNMTWYYGSEKYKICDESCRDECEHVIYQKTISSSQFPTYTYREAILQNDNISLKLEKASRTVGENSLSLNVFYKDGFYQDIKQKPSVTFDVWLSNTGGTLGLFLGASLLSLGELFEVFYEFIIHLIQKRKFDEKTKKAIIKSSET